MTLNDKYILILVWLGRQSPILYGVTSHEGTSWLKRGHCTHHITLLYHHLLGQKYFLSRNFHSQVSSGNHDGITLLQNLIEIHKALLVLYLADELDTLPTRPKYLCKQKWLLLYSGLDFEICSSHDCLSELCRLMKPNGPKQL